jgi:hypothetical protein
MIEISVFNNKTCQIHQRFFNHYSAPQASSRRLMNDCLDERRVSGERNL